MKTIIFPLFVPNAALLLLGEHFVFWEEKCNTQLYFFCKDQRLSSAFSSLDMSACGSALPHDAM